VSVDAALTENDSSLLFSVLLQSAPLLARLGARVLGCYLRFVGIFGTSMIPKDPIGFCCCSSATLTVL
jgi:hypothetical protein